MLEATAKEARKENADIKKASETYWKCLFYLC